MAKVSSALTDDEQIVKIIVSGDNPVFILGFLFLGSNAGRLEGNARGRKRANLDLLYQLVLSENPNTGLNKMCNAQNL